MALHLRAALLCHLHSHTRASSLTSFPAPCPRRRPASFRQSSSPIKLCFRATLGVQCVAVRNSTISEVQGAVHKNSAVQNEEELPPLLASLAWAGLPPCQESRYADEAVTCIRQRWPSEWSQYEAYYLMSISYLSFSYSRTVSHERLAVASNITSLLVVLDDMLFEICAQDEIRIEVLDKFGIDHNIVDKPDRIRQYLLGLDAVFRQEEPLGSASMYSPVEAMMWQLGRDMRALSNPEWFQKYADAALAFYLGSLDGLAADLEEDYTDETNVESYTQMRLKTNGGGMSNLVVEFCNNLFLPTEVREHPTIQQIHVAAWKWSTYNNDLFSYSKEEDEPRSHNVIKVLMASEGLSLPQAAWRTVKMTNAIVEDIMELETRLPTWEDEAWNEVARAWVRGIKEVMAGKLYWYSMQKRYRHAKASFLELRDVHNASLSPTAEHFICTNP